MININNEVIAVAQGAKFCDCGGMMISKKGELLMSDPPKVKIECRFCGHVDYTLSPYDVDIQFKLKGDTE
tara:strand:- start:1589 stop:1798 length:210 start_codon:yes stop_codon:yes gene_type:complete